MRIGSRFLVAVALLWLGASQTPAADPIKPDQFAALHALVKPTQDEEKWLEVPWMTSLWEARQRAAAQGKPIVLWEADGHPLGCT
ncbi:MAG TPA: hypothetical protein VKE94_18375 [Gemmataceae bacterium]|nr:hypothetical protein [Gemmataceae bacterium]